MALVIRHKSATARQNISQNVCDDNIMPQMKLNCWYSFGWWFWCHCCLLRTTHRLSITFEAITQKAEQKRKYITCSHINMWVGRCDGENCLRHAEDDDPEWFKHTQDPYISNVSWMNVVNVVDQLEIQLQQMGDRNWQTQSTTTMAKYVVDLQFDNYIYVQFS